MPANVACIWSWTADGAYFGPLPVNICIVDWVYTVPGGRTLPSFCAHLSRNSLFCLLSPRVDAQRTWKSSSWFATHAHIGQKCVCVGSLSFSRFSRWRVPCCPSRVPVCLWLCPYFDPYAKWSAMMALESRGYPLATRVVSVL